MQGANPAAGQGTHSSLRIARRECLTAPKRAVSGGVKPPGAERREEADKAGMETSRRKHTADCQKTRLKDTFCKKVSVRCPSYGLQEIFKRMQNPLKLRFSQFGLFGGDYHQHSFKCGQFQSISVEHCGLISGQRNKLVLVCLKFFWNNSFALRNRSRC